MSFIDFVDTLLEREKGGKWFAAENLVILKRLVGTMTRIDFGGIRGTAKKRR